MGQKQTVLGVDNIAMANERKALDMSKVSEFCLESTQHLHGIKYTYSLPSFFL